MGNVSKCCNTENSHFLGRQRWSRREGRCHGRKTCRGLCSVQCSGGERSFLFIACKPHGTQINTFQHWGSACSLCGRYSCLSECRADTVSLNSLLNHCDRTILQHLPAGSRNNTAILNVSNGVKSEDHCLYRNNENCHFVRAVELCTECVTLGLKDSTDSIE
jgi:hypothetical protein